jgi:hypothetical protein
MNNLIKAITVENRKRLDDFIIGINNADIKSLFTNWKYLDLLPAAKKPSYNKILDNYTVKGINSIEQFKAYLIKRKEKSINKEIERQVQNIITVYNAGELIEVKISVEWRKSKTWGANPFAECWATFKDANGNTNSSYFVSGSIGGCGYDKLSTAVANCLNQVNEVLKPLYKAKNEAPDKANSDFLGYGSGYGILPHIEGGVGVSCYNRIFNKIGYEFKQVASGKNYDVFMINKM